MKKVYCIYAKYITDCLTANKWYDVISETEDYYDIISDSGYVVAFYKWRFLSTEEAKKRIVKERFE